MGALRESLTATKSELAAAVIPHAETESLRHELFECKERFSQLREALDRHNASEDGALLREAAKVAGHHNKKQRIHFVEKLQEQHRQLQKQNGALTAEVAKLKMLQYSSIEATVHSNYNQGGRGLGLSKSGKENAARVAAVPGAPPVLGKSKSKFKRSLLSRGMHGGRRSRVGSPR